MRGRLRLAWAYVRPFIGTVIAGVVYAGKNVERLRSAEPPLWLVASLILVPLPILFMVGVSFGNG